MSPADAATTALVAATAAHAGFQLTVTAVVYPALARLTPERWPEGHTAHGRAITPVVAVVYGGLALASGWAVTSRPGDVAVLLTVAAAAVAVLTTALVAAPTHGSLADGPDPALLRRLLRADRVRTLAAVAALLGACVAALD